jgi:hypothetical protein
MFMRRYCSAKIPGWFDSIKMFRGERRDWTARGSVEQRPQPSSFCSRKARCPPHDDSDHTPACTIERHREYPWFDAFRTQTLDPLTPLNGSGLRQCAPSDTVDSDDTRVDHATKIGSHEFTRAPGDQIIDQPGRCRDLRDEPHASCHGILEVMGSEWSDLDEWAAGALNGTSDRRDIQWAGCVDEQVVDAHVAIEGVAVDLDHVDGESTESHEDLTDTAGIIGYLDTKAIQIHLATTPFVRRTQLTMAEQCQRGVTGS